MTSRELDDDGGLVAPVDLGEPGEPGEPGGPEGSGRGLSVAAALFHGLSDPSRLAILQHLTLGDHRVRDLTEHLGLAQSTVSAHLACLKECGLVSSRPDGRASVFSLASPRELVALLTAAEGLLATTGSAVALGPNYGGGSLGLPAAGDLRSPAGQGGGR